MVYSHSKEGVPNHLSKLGPPPILASETTKNEELEDQQGGREGGGTHRWPTFQTPFPRDRPSRSSCLRGSSGPFGQPDPRNLGRGADDPIDTHPQTPVG